MLAQRRAGENLAKGMDAVWNKAVGLAGRMVPRQRQFLERAERIVALEERFAQMADSKLREQAHQLREVFRCGRETPSQLELAFALVREVAARQLGERPYPVQVAGALALEAGCVAEMATGEGKTLAATMPATIFGWRGRGCHIITVNDYLAQRDAEWMGKIYRFCGLKVGHIEQGMSSANRREAYWADITYCTNKEVTADFLRDRLALGRCRGLSSALLAKMAGGNSSGIGRLVQRGLHFAIVDEADSVLIDEAVTPLIISGQAPNPEQIETFSQAAKLAAELDSERDYRFDYRYREVELTAAGKQHLNELADPLGGLWRGIRRREELVIQALTAKGLYQQDKHYVIDEGKVVIVDEFTGRLMPDRTWRDGLHQAIEAKETLEVNPPKDTYARVSFQRLFRLYRRLSGMTGTASEAWREFWQIYHLPVVVIPTNRPCIREYWTDTICATESAKWASAVDQIKRLHETSRPILVGTRSVRASENLSQLLRSEGLEHQVLNAVRHAEEAQIVAGAGGAGKITVATNMAGRGTDIKLGRGVAELGGLHVIATERHEAGRIDRQLFGRSARQGDPGSVQAIVSLEDELVQRHAKHLAGSLRRRYGGSSSNKSSGLTPRVFDLAQRRAQRMALRQRKGVLRSDDWLDEYLGFAGSEH